MHLKELFSTTTPTNIHIENAVEYVRVALLVNGCCLDNNKTLS